MLALHNLRSALREQADLKQLIEDPASDAEMAAPSDASEGLSPCGVST
jgi:hypothetical protein